MQKIITILLSMALVACAQNSGVIKYGKNQYMISKQAATGFHGMGNLKADALKEASEQCLSLDKQVEVTKEVDAKPPYILGNFPRTEIHFQCN